MDRALRRRMGKVGGNNRGLTPAGLQLPPGMKMPSPPPPEATHATTMTVRALGVHPIAKREMSLLAADCAFCGATSKMLGPTMAKLPDLFVCQTCGVVHKVTKVGDATDG